MPGVSDHDELEARSSRPRGAALLAAWYLGVKGGTMVQFIAGCSLFNALTRKGSDLMIIYRMLSHLTLMQRQLPDLATGHANLTPSSYQRIAHAQQLRAPSQTQPQSTCGAIYTVG